MLYKVKVETEIMVVANNDKEAIEIAKKNSSNEISMYGKGVSIPVKNLSDIPEDWKNVIPYAQEGITETKKCCELVPSPSINSQPILRGKKELEPEDIDQILKIKENSKSQSMSENVNIGEKIEPKPKELDWKVTSSGRPLQKVRFFE